jgi:hypothetical protein
MSVQIRRLRVVNPHRRRKSSKRRKARRNPGPLLIVTNPHRKGGESMKKRSRKRRRSNPRRRHSFKASLSPRRRSSRRRSNPFAKRSRRRSSYRRNPSLVGYSMTDVAKLGVGAVAGGVGTRAIPNMVLGSKNAGYVGYGANLLTAGLLAWLAAKFDRTAATGVLAGGVASTFQRVWDEQISRLTAAGPLAGLGDMSYSGRRGVGDFIDNSFVLPSVSQNVGGNYITKSPAFALPAARSAVPAGGGMGRPVARYGRRWGG